MTTMKDFIDDYLKRGFGSMNKNDFEVMIMNELLQGEYRNMKNYEISRKLMIPESKVKRLRYEASLKYGKKDEDLLINFLQCLLSAQYVKDSNKIKFVIEDISTRRYLDHLLKNQNLFSDTSFNTELVVITPQSLVELLKNLLNTNHQNLVTDAINNINSKVRVAKLFGVMSVLLQNIVGNVVGEAVSDYAEIFFNSLNNNNK